MQAVFREFFTCELSTLSKNGTPITWPTEPFYQPQHGRFLISTSIGLAQKAYNIRRNPHVALLFSNPAGSGLIDPPVVLVCAGSLMTLFTLSATFSPPVRVGME